MSTLSNYPKSIWNDSLLVDIMKNPEKYKLSEEKQKEADKLAAEYEMEARFRNERNHRNW